MDRHADGPGAAGPVPAAVGDVLRSAGEPLPAAVRTSMEESFAGHLDAISPAPSRGQASSSVVSQPGDPSERQADAVAARVVGGGEPPARAARPDFGEVRVHTGPAAAAAARSVAASAYTVGKHVVLAQPLSDSHAGRRLLAHELTHVVQQSRNPSLAAAATVQRACTHDGKQTGCWASPSLGKVKLTDPLGAVEVHDIGDLVVANMERRFGGTWLPRVTAPPSPKSVSVGYIDGLKVAVGSTLSAEVLEVKPRSTAVAGGCDLADREAAGYQKALAAIATDFVEVSRGLAAAGGLRVKQGSKANAAQARLLLKVGATGTNPSRYLAWLFYNSLQHRLNTTFTTPFDGLNVSINADGQPKTEYDAAPPWIIDCVKKGKKTKGTTTLVYEVSGKGGASYGCNKKCPEEDDDQKRKRKQPALEKGRDRSKDRRLVQEGDEDAIRGPGGPGQPVKDPADRPTPPVKAPGKDDDQPRVDDQSGGDGLDATEITAILVSAAALSAAAAKAKTVIERRALEAAYKKKMVELAQKQATRTAERMMINGVKLGSKQLAHKLEKEAVEVLEKDLEKIAVRQGKKMAGKAARAAARKAAGKAIAKALPFLGLVLTASDALAMADHISKGGTIEIGLGGSDVDLSGSTDVKGKGDKPQGASQDAKLTDTKVDIETSGIPDVSGATEIEAKNVTITGSVTGDGTPVTVSFKTKLQNTTITIKHGGVIKGGKVVLAGDTTIKDSQIEIDLPPGAGVASSGKPVTISGQKLKITKVSSGAGGGTPGTQTPAPDAAAEAEKKQAEQRQAEARLAGLSDGARSRLDAAGKATRDLVAAMLVPGTGKGVKADDAAVDAILKTLRDNKVTEAELAELKKHAGGPATSLDELIKTLDGSIKHIRSKGKGEPGAAGAGDPSSPTKDPKAGTAPAKPVDPNDQKFKRLGKTSYLVAWPASAKVGEVLTGRPAYGKKDGVPWEAVVTVKVVLSGALIVSSSDLRTPTSTLKPWFVGKTAVRLGK